MQAPMLVATEEFTFRGNALASGQMHAAVNAANHIFAFERCGTLSCFLLPLFKRAPKAAYHPQEEHGNKDKEQNSTQPVTSSSAASRRDLHNV